MNMRRRATETLDQALGERIEGDWRTKAGETIQLVWHEDTERENRGWIVHQMSAIVQGQLVGYLKVSFIPEERRKKYYPDVASYLTQVKGTHGLTHEDPRERLRYYSTQCETWHNWLSREDVDAMSEGERAERLARYTAQVEEKHRDAFAAFVHFHVDKPLVDYVYIDPAWRRQRIALALYQATAERLNRAGLDLYASGVQSDDARMIWAHIRSTSELGEYVQDVDEPGPRKKKRQRIRLSSGGQKAGQR